MLFWSVLVLMMRCFLFGRFFWLLVLVGRFWSVLVGSFGFGILFCFLLVGFVLFFWSVLSVWSFYLFLNIWSVFLTKNGIGFHAFALCSNFVFCFDFNPLKIP